MGNQLGGEFRLLDAALLQLLQQPVAWGICEGLAIRDSQLLQQFLAFAANAAHGAQFALCFGHRITAAAPAAERAFAPVVGQWRRVAAFEVLLQPRQGGLHLVVEAAVEIEPLALSAGIDQPALAGRSALHRLQQPAPERQGEAVLPGAVATRLQQCGLVAEGAQLAGLRFAQ